MSSNMLPIYLLGVVVLFTLIMKVTHSWKAAAGGLVILLLIADSIIAGLRALFQ